MKEVIGISLGYNTSAAVVHPSQGIKLAISEERLNGEKNTKQFPINALKECIKTLKFKDNSTDTLNIGISSYEVINDRTMKYMPEEFKVLRTNFSNFWDALTEHIRIECNIPEEVLINIKRIEHHEAHALPAIYMSGFLQDPFTKTISITYDGFGDGVCATILDCETNEIIAREYIENSLGLVYQYVTGALGFKEHQHEGKITGLAAFGEPKYLDVFEDFFIGYDHVTASFIPNYLMRGWVDNTFDQVEINSNIHGFKNMIRLKNRVYEFITHLKENARATDADIAATVQIYTEKLITQWINDRLEENQIDRCNIVLSGGVFANVKVNYAIYKAIKPSQLFVLPPMGDEGTSIGAAIGMIIKTTGESSLRLDRFAADSLYLGKVKSDKTFRSELIDRDKYNVFNLDIMADKTIVKYVSNLLAMGKIVCVSRGNSEFGPRALGNHSILFDASEKETNDSLNKRLSRTEFMPFAPISIDKFSQDLFLDTKGLEKTLKYMTIAVPVTEEFKAGYKAAYHVDFTARPQILSSTDNPIIYRIIDEYYNLTNKKALINTSFNLHNHPIIYDDITALESFMTADLDVLLLDDVLIIKRDF